MCLTGPGRCCCCCCLRQPPLLEAYSGDQGLALSLELISPLLALAGLLISLKVPSASLSLSLSRLEYHWASSSSPSSTITAFNLGRARFTQQQHRQQNTPPERQTKDASHLIPFCSKKLHRDNSKQIDTSFSLMPRRRLPRQIHSHRHQIESINIRRKEEEALRAILLLFAVLEKIAFS